MIAPDFLLNLNFQVLRHICPEKTNGAILFFVQLVSLTCPAALIYTYT